jgi:multicomponent Na+:H+ antiporter subunit D
MIDKLPPGWILLIGGLLVPLVPRRARSVWLLVVPLLSGAHMLLLAPTFHTTASWLGLELLPVRVDALSLPFGVVFHVAALLAVIYALHVDDVLQQGAALAYSGAAVAAVFAGDLLTLFVYWELTAFASAFLIWARRTPASYRAGMRYLVIQIGSGAFLLAGAVLRWRATGSLAFEGMSLGDTAANLLFFGIGIKCAFPLLHNWVQDSYPESTVTGTVFLSVFTTKLAVYALARGFAGTSLLLGIGAVMTAFPIFYAVIENDLRRVLAYSLNNQLGFMVAGIGIGTQAAVNGAVAYAFCNVLFEGLLFMTMGAVLFRTGTAKGSELGGLYKSMPWTTACCIVGAASISGFPLFSGFISKPLILDAVADGQHLLVWFVLVFASAGVFHHAGIKIPFFAFFAHDAGIRCREAPMNMLVAMGASAAACVTIGVAPTVLYGLLPFPVEHRPYTASHVVAQTQLLFWAGLAFSWLVRTGLYPKETPSVNLDSDWIYRRLVPDALRRAAARWQPASEALAVRVRRGGSQVSGGAYRLVGPGGALSRAWTPGAAVLWVVFLLGVFLLLYYGRG